ncbi:hypothetical protein [Roseovarius aestuarii]|uniref:Uncharacterized protein n=1 Tax=Roseovarius aestuarii TaxID=475083 RepID=A0A1X7BWR4_9RHOB|nr:hypothetical protein [Roseovarius aestuarii]SMC14063.1 hypothetical protein ROA7745_03927 [Roseovarius aestuarii]
MTDILSREAAQDYFSLTLLSFNYGIIGESILLERLAVLSSIGKQTDGATVFANEILQDNDRPQGHNDWSEDWQERERSEINDNNGERITEGRSDDDPGDPFLHLVIAVGGNRWEFHPFDDDWFPSVPHGHKLPGRSTDKLDPYLGWIYDKSKQSGRLKRKAIIALWNDDQFRETANRAIDYYLYKHPHYRGWRVPNPRRLPRRRKS